MPRNSRPPALSHELAASLVALLVGAHMAASCASSSREGRRPDDGANGAVSRESRRDPTESWTPPGPACRNDGDCEDHMRCYVPGFTPGPGMQMAPPPPCKDDAECGDRRYCGEGICYPRCSGDTECSVTERCEASRCVALRCASAGGHGPCPINFSCDPELNCQRDKCTNDDDCEMGACVAGTCYAQPGGCESQGYCCPP